jgi:hypothetical protein
MANNVAANKVDRREIVSGLTEFFVHRNILYKSFSPRRRIFVSFCLTFKFEIVCFKLANVHDCPLKNRIFLQYKARANSGRQLKDCDPVEPAS